MDLKLSGSSVVPGGEYGKISLSGATVISGDVVCDSLTASGALKCEAVECRGAVTLSGSLSCSAIQCDSVSIRGKAEIEKGNEIEPGRWYYFEPMTGMDHFDFCGTEDYPMGFEEFYFGIIKIANNR